MDGRGGDECTQMLSSQSISGTDVADDAADDAADDEDISFESVCDDHSLSYLI